MKTKKSSLPLNYMFIIFISVIAVFVIVGMISKWAFSSNKFMCKLTGDCDESMIIDKQTINVDSTGDNTRFVNEIIKHAKICYERARKGEVKGELCYTVKCNDCEASCSDVQADIESSLGNGKVECSGFTASDKAIIEFDYSYQRVLIK
ncbi:hypothetical protein JXB41_02135 [Candidatus Woesearchaeota archaeon]|nr:hypothetical protein [Candidatus Woesearchaeota archaeon]